LSHFITYLFLIYLPMFIIFICHSAIPKNPASHCFLMATILRGPPWPPQGHRGPIFSKMQEGENESEEQALPGNNERQSEGSPFCPDNSLTQGWVPC
jgi:hypothetical protein